MATRSSGMQSDKYGDIAEITRGLRVVMPGKVLVHPAAAQHLHRTQRPRDDPGLARAGSAIITEVTVQVHRIPRSG